MRISKLHHAVVAVVAGVVLLAGVAAATVVGVVTALGKHDITVSGATYSIDDAVAIEDMAGHPITLPELRPGTNVELDFDESGVLTRIRAAVVR